MNNNLLQSVLIRAHVERSASVRTLLASVGTSENLAAGAVRAMLSLWLERVQICTKKNRDNPTTVVVQPLRGMKKRKVVHVAENM